MVSLRKSRLPYDILYLLIKSIVDHKTLARIARTCRALSDVALRELWQNMESLVPLLLLIPIKFYDFDALEAAACQTLRLPKERWHEFRKRGDDQDDPQRFVTRMLAYGKRIKILRGVHTYRYDIHYETLEFLLDELPSILGVEHVIPNLTKLSLLNNEVSIHELSLQVRKLFVPDLQSVILTSSCRGLLDYLDEVIIALLQNCPKLMHLKVVCTGRLWDGRPQVVLDLESCLTPRVQEVLRTMTANATSLKSIRFSSIDLTGYRDIIATPSTLNVFGLFKSITHLKIGLKTSEKYGDYGLTDGPGTAFPALRNLRLRLHGSTPVTWFLDFISASRLECVYFHFMDDVRTLELNTFISSLDRFKSKFSKVNSLSLRATIYDQVDLTQGPSELIQSIVTSSAQLFPHLTSLKLKLFPMYHTQWGLVQADDLPHIAGAFPGLQSLKLAAFGQYTCLKDVVALAQRFPRLRTIGINFHRFRSDSRCEDEMENRSSSSDSETPALKSGLRTLAVRYSEIHDPEKVAAYLRKRLPCLWNVVRSRHSTHKEWDQVHAWIRASYPMGTR